MTLQTITTEYEKMREENILGALLCKHVVFDFAFSLDGFGPIFGVFISPFLLISAETLFDPPNELINQLINQYTLINLQ